MLSDGRGSTATHIMRATGLLLLGSFWVVLRTYRQRIGEARFHSLVQNISDIITVVDGDGTVGYQSPSVERVLGYTPGELIGRNVFALVHPDDVERAKAVCDITLDNPAVTPTAEVRVQHRDGSWRHMEVLYNNRLDDPGVRGLVLNGRDITERKAFEEQMAHQALHDPLTSLPNRALFMDRLEHALARAARKQTLIAVLFLDLDRFTIVNDSLGHAAGDELLVAVAGRLQGCLRITDTVARLGGDEFTLLLEDLSDEAGAAHVAERIMEALRAPFVVGGHEVFTTPSIGVVLGGPERETPADFMRHGDVALYRAKARGRARYEIFHTSMKGRSLERLKLEGDLRRALERGEFVIYYQPTVDLETGHIKGVEALVRWAHPERGLVPPAEFIPVAEEMGLIRILGRWVLEEACRQARAWHEPSAGDSPLIMSVNLSAQEIQQSDLVENIAGVLRETGLDPHLLQLEITESVIMEDAASTMITLRALKDLGVQLAIDDFGTGYSSLSYLKRFPVDMLKVDKAFVAGLGKDLEDTAIVQAVITLASTLGMRVTAEGVESAAQLAQLRALGSQLAQGYYFAKPLASEAVSQLFAQETFFTVAAA